MHLIELQVENFRRIRLARLRLDGNRMVRVCGNNAQGKTSLLDAFETLLRGKRHTVADPVHHGAERARLIGDFGKYKVIRTIDPDRSQKVKVIAADGSTKKGPETVLKQLLGDHSLDPLAFMRCDGKEQAATLRKLAGIDTGDNEVARERAYMRRTDVNRALKQARAEAQGMPWHDDAPSDPTDASELVAEIAAAQAANEAHGEAVGRLERARADHRRRAERIAELRAELETLEAEHAEFKAKGAEMRAEVEAMPHHDLEPMRERLKGITEENAKAEDNRRRREANERADAREKESNALTAEIERLDREKAEMLEGATMPVEGLEVTDDGVQYQGVPLEQASQAEKIRISAAIAFALKPEIKIVMIHDASLLDQNSMRLLCEMAEEHDGQVICEVVGDGDVGVVFEDGEIVKADGEPVGLGEVAVVGPVEEAERRALLRGVPGAADLELPQG